MVTGSTLSPTDEELAQEVATGDEAAFSQLYERHFSGAHDFAARIVHDRDLAAEVVQNSFVRAWETLREGEPPRRFKAWLYTIARNQSIDELRRRKRELSISGDGGEGTIEYTLADRDRLNDPAAVVQDADLTELVWAAASSLGPAEYSLLDMHVRQALSIEEMSEALEIKTGTLYTRLSRLRHSLEQSLSAELLRRRGTADCPELEALVASFEAPELRPEDRRAIEAHTDTCDVCSENKSRFLTASEILAAFVPIPALPGMQSQIWDRVAERASPASPGGADSAPASSGSGAPSGPAATAAGSSRTAGVLGTGVSKLVLIGAGGVLAAAVAGFALFSGGGDGDEAAASETVVAGGATTAGATATVAAIAPTTIATPIPVSTLPEDRVVIASAVAMADANGDVWVLLVFANPWEGEPPTIDFAHSVQLGAGVELNGQMYGTLWTAAGTIRFSTGIPGAPTLLNNGTNPIAIPGEMWITPGGMLAIRLPGNSATGGVDRSLVTAETTLVIVSSVLATSDAAPAVTRDRVPLGSFAVSGSLPLAEWIELGEVQGSVTTASD